MERVDPPAAAGEATTLDAFLDYYRASLALKLEGLPDADARRASIPPSDLNLLGLLRHMAEVERNWFRRAFKGEDVGPIWYGDAHPDGDPDGDLHPGPHETVGDAMAVWKAEIHRARAICAAASLDDLAVRESQAAGGVPNLRWIMVHLIEEYARHCGHADLLRQAIDGTVGD